MQKNASSPNVVLAKAGLTVCSNRLDSGTPRHSHAPHTLPPHAPSTFPNWSLPNPPPANGTSHAAEKLMDSADSIASPVLAARMLLRMHTPTAALPENSMPSELNAIVL